MQRGSLGIDTYLRLTGRVLRKRDAAAIIALGVAVALLEAVGLFLLLPLLGLVGIETGVGGTAPLATLARRALDAVGVPVALSSVLIVYVVVISVQAAIAHLEAVMSVRVRESTAARLRELLHASIVRMDWRSLVQRPSAHYVNALTTQLARVYIGIAYSLVLVSQVLVALVYIGLAVRLQPWVSALALVSGLLLMLLTQRYSRRVSASGESLTAASERLHALVVEHLATVKVAKTFGMEVEHSRHFALASRQLAAGWSEAGAAFAGTRTIFAAGTAATLALVVYASVGIVALNPAAVLLLLYAFARLVPRLAAVQHTIQQLIHSRAAFNATILELDRCEAAAERIAPGSGGVSARLSLQRELRISDIVVSYEGRGEVLHGVSLTVPAAALTAVVGLSGAGKTTLADVVLGLISPDAGEITVDGVCLDAATLQAWRRSIAYVPQDAVLFNDTVRSNLLLVAPGATEEQLQVALRAAHADFVFDLPQGIDTLVGERGTYLSGGERQRVALARALVRDPEMLVLDEAMSHLDPVSERAVMHALSAQKRRLAVFLISHRLHNLQIADNIYVIEGGRLVEQGTWSELVRAGGRFGDLLHAAQA